MHLRRATTIIDRGWCGSPILGRPTYIAATAAAAPPMQQAQLAATWRSDDVERFLTEGRDWKAVARFYRLLVSGHANLTQLGLTDTAAYQASPDTQALPPTTCLQQALELAEQCEGVVLTLQALDSEATEQSCVVDGARGVVGQHVQALGEPCEAGEAWEVQAQGQPQGQWQAQGQGQAQGQWQTQGQGQAQGRMDGQGQSQGEARKHAHSEGSGGEDNAQAKLHPLRMQRQVMQQQPTQQPQQQPQQPQQLQQPEQRRESQADEQPEQQVASTSAAAEPFQNGPPRLSQRKAPKDKRPRITYQLEVAYFGPSFCGLMAQPGGLPTVSGVVDAGLTALFPPGTDWTVPASSGRTDKGVSAVGQVLSFFSRHEVSAEAIGQAVAAQAPDATLRVVSVRRRGKSFHATFGAKWRRYVYLFPLLSEGAAPAQGLEVDASLAAALLQRLEGRTLDYTALARDTPAGKSCVCTLHRARVTVVQLPPTASTLSTPSTPPTLAPALGHKFSAQQGDSTTDGAMVLCIELVADRFLRRMVRVLVSTLLQLAARPRHQLHAAQSDAGNAPLASQGLSPATCLRTSLPTTSWSHGSGSNGIEPPEARAGGVGGAPLLPEGGTPAAHSFPASSPAVGDGLNVSPAQGVSRQVPEDALLQLVMTGDRALTARFAAPALGLCFAGVGYDDVAP